MSEKANKFSIYFFEWHELYVRYDLFNHYLKAFLLKLSLVVFREIISVFREGLKPYACLEFISTKINVIVHIVLYFLLQSNWFKTIILFNDLTSDEYVDRFL